MPVNDDHELQQARKETQIRIARHRPTQDPVARDDTDLSHQIGQRIASKFARRISGAHARDTQACKQANHCEAEKNHSGPDLAPSEFVGQESREHHRGDEARNVPSSRIPFPQESLFSGSSSGSSPYFDGPNNAPCVLIRKTEAASMVDFPKRARPSQRAHADFKELGADRDGALAIAVGEKSPDQRKQNKWNREQCSRQARTNLIAHGRQGNPSTIR